MPQLNLPPLPIDCPFYRECQAQLCPDDPSLGQRLWFPGEPVCRRRKAPDWVAKQRRLSRLKSIDREKYFTVPMLNVLTEIDRDCIGADPAVEDDEQAWLRRHRRATRRRRPPTPEQGRLDLDF